MQFDDEILNIEGFNDLTEEQKNAIFGELEDENILLQIE
jgi:hypothetical protein